MRSTNGSAWSDPRLTPRMPDAPSSPSIDDVRRGSRRSTTPCEKSARVEVAVLETRRASSVEPAKSASRNDEPSNTTCSAVENRAFAPSSLHPAKRTSRTVDSDSTTPAIRQLRNSTRRNDALVSAAPEQLAVDEPQVGEREVRRACAPVKATRVSSHPVMCTLLASALERSASTTCSASHSSPDSTVSWLASVNDGGEIRCGGTRQLATSWATA